MITQDAVITRTIAVPTGTIAAPLIPPTDGEPAQEDWPSALLQTVTVQTVIVPFRSWI